MSAAALKLGTLSIVSFTTAFLPLFSLLLAAAVIDSSPEAIALFPSVTQYVFCISSFSLRFTSSPGLPEKVIIKTSSLLLKFNPFFEAMPRVKPLSALTAEISCGAYQYPDGGLFSPFKKRTDLYFNPSNLKAFCTIVVLPLAPDILTLIFASPDNVVLSDAVTSSK